MEENRPKISNVEWGLVIGALATVDIFQIVLDIFAIGIILNRFIDILVGMALAFYLHIRGQSLTNMKRILGMIGTFVGEQIPGVDAFPLWSLDGIFNMMLAKAEEKANEIESKIPGGAVLRGKFSGGGDDNSTPNIANQRTQIPLQSNNFAAAKPWSRLSEAPENTRKIGDLVDPKLNKMRPSRKPDRLGYNREAIGEEQDLGKAA